MLKDFPVKIDSVGRLVVPKEIRDSYDLSNMYFIDDGDTILLKKIDSVVQVDSYGRVLIPKKLRDKFFIDRNSSVLLSSVDNGLMIINNYGIFNILITKLHFLEEKYTIYFFLCSKDIIKYASPNFSKFKGFDFKELELNFEEGFHTKKVYFREKPDAYLVIVYKDVSDEIISLVSKLLS